MGENGVLKYNDGRPTNKLLPKRGTLFASRSDIVGAHWFIWGLVNLGLIFAPLIIGALTVLLLHSRLEIPPSSSVFDIIWTLIYCSFSTTCYLIIFGTWAFPRWVGYKSILLASIFPRPRHRSHFTFMSQRRMNAVCGKSRFTIFVTGFRSRSLPVLVTDRTNIADIYRHLMSIGIVPSGLQELYSTHLGRRAAWSDKMGSLGLGALSHLHLHVRVLGGANEDGPEPGSSRPVRTKNPEREQLMKDVYNEEKLDEFGNVKKSTKAKGKRKRKEKPVNTDSEDEDFGASSESSTDDSEIEEVIGNDEVAASLPTRTLLKNASRKGKAPERKKAKRTQNSSPGPSTSTSTATASTSTATANTTTASTSTNPGSLPPIPGPKKRRGGGKKTHAIYLFFEEVDSPANGVAVEGSQYFKCWLGNRVIIEIPSTARYNVSKLKSHLEATSKAHYRLFQVLHARPSTEPVTDVERGLAQGTMTMTSQLTAEYKEAADQISGNIRELLEKQQAASKVPWDKEHFDDLVAKWVAACDQPFTAVNKLEFREMLQYAALHPADKPIVIPKREAVKLRIQGMEKEMVEELSAIFKANKSDFAMSLDAWTSSNGYAFLAIVIHYIGNNGELEECLIDFRELSGAHTGENMAAAVWETVEKFSLRNRIIAFVMDNATNNDTLVETFSEKCHKLGIAFDSEHARMRCMPHTIHLAALKLLECIGALTREERKKAAENSRSSAYQDSTTDSLSAEAENFAAATQVSDTPDDTMKPSSQIGLAVFKLRKIVKHVRSSPQRRENWKKIIENLNKSCGADDLVLMLILDVKTRWSSTHQMLRRAIQFRTAITGYVTNEPELRDCELSIAEWDALILVTGWLKSFRSATTQMSSTRQSMLSTTHTIFRGLQQHLKDAISALPQPKDSDTDTALRDGLVAAHLKLSDYYTKFDQSRYYMWASLLDPGISYERLQADFKDDPDSMEVLEDAKMGLETEYDVAYAPTLLPSTSSSAVPESDGSPQKVDFLARYKRAKASEPLQHELAEYFRITGVAQPYEDDIDALQWWYNRRKRFPNLYRLIRNVLCIPGSAVAVERVFSGGRDTIGLRRASLKAGTIQMLMFVKARLRCARAALEREEKIVSI